VPPSSRPPKDPAQEYLRTTFLERVAHEVRGPAGTTSGALDEIERAMGDRAEALRPFFSIARRGLGRLLRSADRLARTAIIEEGAIAGGTDRVDLRELAAAAVRDSVELEARRSVRVEVTAGDEECPVLAEPAWVRTAIAEVVGNAIRFARAAVHVDTRLVDGEVSVTVLDDGPGFGGPVPRRFETPPQRSGLGLSLPLVDDVVKKHHGRLSVEDRKTEEDGPRGTRVVLAFPCASARA